MKPKQWAIISYITLIGWIIAFVKTKDEREKNGLISYHLEQALGLMIAGIVWSIAISIVLVIVPALKTPLSILSLLPFIFMVFGIINANSGTNKPLPLIGKLFENKFVFLQTN
ncbi:DUF4870 domain-containing protein [Chitinophaga vietnamensis]|uniref:DUF4870 domain-containing protein n=1 Tax=Chitinophaga vietnamensis TaxID=2593957 RepID=UPI001177CA80|nr:DUF4870 domain-containing protein [Chitinophaga vietnamensis]